MDGGVDARSPRPRSCRAGSFEIRRRDLAIIRNFENQVIAAILLGHERIEPLSQVLLRRWRHEAALDQFLGLGGQAMPTLARALDELALELRLDVTDQQIGHGIL